MGRRLERNDADGGSDGDDEEEEEEDDDKGEPKFKRLD